VVITISNTDLIATLPTQIVATLIQICNLSAFQLPFEVPGFSVGMLWHRKHNQDPGHLWLRELITQLS